MRRILDRVSSWKDRASSSGAPQGSGGSGGNPSGSDAHSRGTRGPAADLTPRLLMIAAQYLTDAIHEILSNGASLSGEDTSGFTKFLRILESDPPGDLLSGVSWTGEEGSLKILARFRYHATFTDACVQANLTPALVHALRLLRMLEVIQGGQVDAEGRGVTYAATVNVCAVMEILCAHPASVDQLRPLLTKFLCFPLAPQTKAGLHLQRLSQKLLSVFCSQSLTSQIVWLLHDSMAMKFVTRAYQELISTEQAESDNSNFGGSAPLLRGASAEEHNMWLCGLECVVELVSASYAFSSVLLSDLEDAGGFNALIHVAVHSRNDRCIKAISTLSRLLVNDNDDKNRDDPQILKITQACVGSIFKGILLSVVGVSKPLKGDESVEQLIEICTNLLAKSPAAWKDRDAELIIESSAYSLLTMCSNNINNYIMLEQVNHILAAMILCIPSFKQTETLNAVMKALIYVGGEGRPTFEIICMCASLSVMLQHVLYMITDSNPKQLQAYALLESALGSLEEILNFDPKYSAIFSLCGFKYMVFEPLSFLLQAAPVGRRAKIPRMDIYRMLIRINCTVLRRNTTALASARMSKVLDVVLDIITNSSFDSEDVLEFLDIAMCLINPENEELEDNFVSLFKAINSLKDSKQHYRLAKLFIRLSETFLTQQTMISNLYKCWNAAKGFECILGVIGSLKGVFPADSHSVELFDSIQGEGDKSYVCCLHRALGLIAAILSGPPTTAPVPPSKGSRVYFRDKIKYASLAKALHETGVLASAYVGDCLTQLFCVMGTTNSGPQTSQMTNPEGAILIIDTLEYLRQDLAILTIHLLEQTAFSQIDGAQALVQSGVTRHIIMQTQHILTNPDHPLQEHMSHFFLKICSENLVLGDFGAVLKHLIRPDVIIDLEDRRLLPPWSSFDQSGAIAQRNWYSIQVALSLMKQTIRQQGSSYVSLGPDASYRPNESAFVDIPWAEASLGRSFSMYAFTYTAWFQIDENAAMKGRFGTASGSGTNATTSTSDGGSGSILPLLVVITAGLGICMELQIDVQKSIGYIVYRKDKNVGVVTFKMPYISEGDWHLCSLTFKRPRRLVLNVKTAITIYFDGLVVFSDNLEMEFPSSGSANLIVGQRMFGTEYYGSSALLAANSWSTVSDTHIVEGALTSLDPAPVVSLWRLGPLYIFDDALSQVQISRVLIKGPSYHGNFQGESPLIDSLPTLVTDTLCRCNAFLQDLQTQLEALGVKTMEMIVIPMIDNAGDGLIAIELATVPVPLLAYSGVSFVKLQSKSPVTGGPLQSQVSSSALEVPGFLSPRRRDRSTTQSVDLRTASTIGTSGGLGFHSSGRIVLNNLAVDGAFYPQAEVVNGHHIARVESVARCVAAIGGPNILFPLLQTASTESQLLMSLNLLRSCVRLDSSNLKYMQTGGYQMISFMLTAKPKSLITPAVVESLFLFAVDKGTHFQPEKASKSNEYKSLLVDTQALYYLILNHQVWGADRYAIAKVIVDLLRMLVSEDAYHSVLNAKRLSLLGVTRWVLLLLVYGVTRSCSAKAIGAGPEAEAENAPKLLDASISPTAQAASSSCDHTNTWRISCLSASEVATRRDGIDPFLVSCISLLRPLLKCRLRQVDVELLGQIVHNAIFSTVPIRKIEITNVFLNYAATKSANSADHDVDGLFNNQNGSLLGSMRNSPGASRNPNELTPLGMMAVALIRFVRELYISKSEHIDITVPTGADTATSNFTGNAGESHILQESQLQRIYSRALPPHWFIAAIDKSSDFASTGALLRLLACRVQSDSSFLKSFCAANGFIILNRLLAQEPQEMAVVLPIMAMFFGIPVGKLPMPNHNDTLEDKIIDLLKEYSNGPILSSPELADFMIPCFNILLNLLAQNTHDREANLNVRYSASIVDLKPQNTLTIATFKFMIITSKGFREFLQCRPAISALIKAILRCSDAMKETGSRIYSNDEQAGLRSINLSAAIQDNYLDMRREKETSAVESNKTFEGEDVGKINLIYPEGSSLASLLGSILMDSMNDFQNPQIIEFCMLTFPKFLSEIYIGELHRLVINQWNAAIKHALSHMDMNALSITLQMFYYLVPMTKARIVGDEIVFGILQSVFSVLDALYATETDGKPENEKISNLILEYGNVARYFTIIAMWILATNDEISTDLHHGVLTLIRSRLRCLFFFAVDENEYRTKKEFMNPIPTDDNQKGALVLDSYQMAVGAASSNVLTKRIPFFGSRISSVIQAEIYKFTQLFSHFIFFLCHQYLADPIEEIRFEAVRILAGFVYFRRVLVTSMFLGVGVKATLNKTLQGKDESDMALADHLSYENAEAFFKLIPQNSSASFSQIVKQFTQVYIERDPDEVERLNAFLDWFSSGSYNCKFYVGPVEQILASLVPSKLPVIEVLKSVQRGRSPLEDAYESDNPLIEAYTISSAALRYVVNIDEEVTQWSIYGVSENASGAKYWMHCWTSLQCSPIWGSLPLAGTDKFHNRVNPFILSPSDATIGRIFWRLGYLVGPENMRRRIECDFVSFAEDDDKLEAKSQNNYPQIEVSSIRRGDSSSIDVDMVLRNLNRVSYKSYSRSDRVSAAVDSDEFFNSTEIEKSIANVEASTEDATTEQPVESESLKASSKFGLEENENEIGTVRSLYRHKADDRGSAEVSSPSASASNVEGASNRRVGGRFSHNILATAIVTTLSDDTNSDNLKPKLVKLSSRSSADDNRSSMSSIASRQSIMSAPMLTATTETLAALDPSANESLLQLATTPKHEMNEAMRKNLLLNEILAGLIGVQEWATGTILNVQRIFGLESHPAVFVMTSKNIHILDGFQVQILPGTNERLIQWTSTIEMETSTLSAKQKESNSNNSKNTAWGFGCTEETQWMKKIWKHFLRDDVGYIRMNIESIYSIFRRRHHLQDVAIEITTTKGFSILTAFSSKVECENVMKRLLEMDLPNSMFRLTGLNNIQLGAGLMAYKRTVAYYISYAQKLWLRGCISNFEYLMHLNFAAGRSFQDLTQYPVFPWVLADYESDELDLNDPASFRDLTKPMGALGEKRREQYIERYVSMKEIYMADSEEDKARNIATNTPPFFYGTHYSCAGYVLHYLMRMQPFSRMAVSLQGGQFDKPDRLFRSIGQSWKSASEENLQDVRELVPEFYFLPDFLVNSNNFDLGRTQRGDIIDDVVLPPWANNDPMEFIRKHREALESRYVSENLHHWIDLIFGYKQRGKEAEDALNVFIHLTYEGEVDVDTITDQLMKEATISQINNFGQTPSCLFLRPHPKKQLPPLIKRAPGSENAMVFDFNSLQFYSPMTPPLTIVGASHISEIYKIYYGPASFVGQSTKGTMPVGDLWMLNRDRLLAVPAGQVLIPPKYTSFVKFWRPSGSISVHTVQAPIRQTESDRSIEIHENLHFRPVSCVAVSSDGSVLVTGSEDRSVRLWLLPKPNSNSHRFVHLGTLSGHSGSICCVDICLEYNIVVSGAEDRTAMIWDAFSSKLLRVIAGYNNPVISVSINKLSGNIAVLTTAKLGIYTVNGTLVSLISLQDFNVNQLVPQDPTGKLSSMHAATYSAPNISMVFKMKPRVVLAPPCADWQDGVVAITGHEGGFVYLWKIHTIQASSADTLPGLIVSPYDTDARPNSYVRRILVPYSTLRAHRADISVLRLCPWIVPKAKQFVPRTFEGENGAELVIGDIDGNVSRWEVGRLEQMSVQELNAALSRYQLNTGMSQPASRRPANEPDIMPPPIPAPAEPDAAARPGSPNNS